jgi:triacylglycerol esterase/lipase EstA (alpha/beta hydrolase family)
MWTAVTLWIVHAAGLAIYVLVAARAIAGGAAPWRWILGAAIGYSAIIAVFTLAQFALSWIWRAPRPVAQRIGAARTLAMIAAEFRTLIGSPWRMMTWRWRVTEPTPATGASPVVLVHGVFCNAGVFAWTIRRFAEEALGPVYALSYGPPLAPIERFSKQLATLVDAACRDTGAAQVVIVAHSMGGLVARDYLRTYGGAKVARVVTLGTPHHGSRFASLAAGRCLAQMRPGNGWLAALPSAPAAPPIVSLWSPHDSMVAPQTSAVLEGATNVAFLGIGHNALLRDRRVHARVVAEIRASRSAIATTSGSPC